MIAREIEPTLPPDLVAALRILLPELEALERRSLVGDEGCLWPVETIRYHLGEAGTVNLAPIESSLAILDVTTGRDALARAIDTGKRPVHILGHIVGTWGRDDGTSIEFHVEVDHVTVGDGRVLCVPLCVPGSASTDGA